MTTADRINGDGPPQPASGSNGAAHAAAAAAFNTSGWTPDQVNEMWRLVGNAFSLRRDAFQQLTDPRRDVDHECGYPKGLIVAEVYQELYEREAVAARVVQVMPRECWQVQPTVYESEESDEVTPFEEAWDELGSTLRGDASWFMEEEGSPVWEYLRRGDELCGIGHYGAMLLGLNDGLPLHMPARGVVEEGSRPVEWADGEGNAVGQTPADPSNAWYGWANGSLAAPTPRPLGRNSSTKGSDRNSVPVNMNGGSVPHAGSTHQHGPAAGQAQGMDGRELCLRVVANAAHVGQFSPYRLTRNEVQQQDRRLNYLRVFPEWLCRVTQYESNMLSPRYGRPVMYLVTFNDPRNSYGGIGLTMTTLNVHWTRMVHLADNLDGSDVFGVPRMRPVLNRILSLRQVYGADGEAFWKNSLMKLIFSTLPQLGPDAIIDKTDVRNQMEQFTNGLQGYLGLQGLAAQVVAPAVVDPTAHAAAHVQAICIQLGVPQRVFMGSERGELASSQDDAAWNDRLRARNRNHTTPRVIVPLVDRLIQTGVLPVPKAKTNDEPPPTPDQLRPLGKAAGGNPFARPQDPPPPQPAGPFGGPPRSAAAGKPNPFSRNAVEDDADTTAAAGGSNGKSSNTLPGIKGSKGKGKTGYRIDWPDLESEGATEKATVALTETQAMVAYVGGGVNHLVPEHDFLTRVLGWTEEEAAATLASASESIEQEHQDQADVADTHDMPPSPPPGFAPPHPTPPPTPPGAGAGGAGGANGPKGVPGDKRPKPPPPKAGGVGLPPAGGGGIAVKNVDNSFCPTGEGGGVDASCSPGGGGGGSIKTPEQHAEDERVESARDDHDAARDDRRDKEDEKLQKVRDREDTGHDREEAGHDREDERLGKGRDKEDAALERGRTREDRETERSQAAEEKGLLAGHKSELRDLDAAHAGHLASLDQDHAEGRLTSDQHEDARDTAEAAHHEARSGVEARHLEEHAALQDLHDKHDTARAAARESEDAATGRRRDAEDADLSGRRDDLAEWRETLYQRRTKEDEGTQAARASEDDAMEHSRKQEDHERNIRHARSRGVPTANYSPDQPREPDGKFSGGGTPGHAGKVVVYHGTTAERTASVVKEGMKPDVGTSGTAAYFTTNPTEAFESALIAAGKKAGGLRPGDAVSVVHALAHPEHDEHVPAYQYKGREGDRHYLFRDGLPADKIHEVRTYDAHAMKKWLRAKDAAPEDHEWEQFRLPARNEFSPDQPRDTSGKWTSDGGGGGTTADGAAGTHGTTPSPRTGLGGMADRVKAVGGKVGHMEHVVKQYVADKIEGTVNRLPPAAQSVVRGVFAAVRVGARAAFASYELGQALAERVARERGSTADQAKQLRGVLASVDMLAAKPMAVAGGVTGSMVPVATCGYLAYSTARNPLAVARAATGMVRDGLKAVGGLFTKGKGDATGQVPTPTPRTHEPRHARLGVEGLHRNAADVPEPYEVAVNGTTTLLVNGEQATALALAQGLEQHDHHDWYVALLAAALDATRSVTDSLALADVLYDPDHADAMDLAVPQDGDQQAVLGDLGPDDELTVTGGTAA